MGILEQADRVGVNNGNAVVSVQKKTDRRQKSTGNRVMALFFLSSVLCVLFPVPASGQDATKKLPVTVNADKLDYDRTNDIYTAVGHVRIEQEGIRFEADRVVLNNKTGEAEAEGKVYLQDRGDVIRADKLKFNITTHTGVIYHGEIFMSKENYHIKGEVIERRSETVYHVERGTFTTCDQGEWYLEAREMDVDLDKYATGKGVSFNMTGLPVLYTPYLLFPVRRQTGLLIPEVGHSSVEGVLIRNAFFWAISDSKDMTLYSDYRARLGHGTGVEYRYAFSRDSSGKAFFNWFDTFHSRETRWNFTFQHQEEFAEDLSGRVDLNLVSDPFYYRDLEKKLELRSRPYVDSNAFYVERWDTASLYLLGQYSTDLTQSNEKTVQKLPELRYTIFEEKIAGPIHLNLDGSAVNFSREEGNGARRVDFSPNVTAALGVSGLNLAPRAGLRATFYDQSKNSVEPSERRYYFAGADLNARFSRVYGTDSESGIGRIRHSIEPTVSYMYAPHVEQSNIPQFDSVDSVFAQNLVTYSLINRLTAHYKDAAGSRTYDMMVLRLSQSYDFNVARDETLTAPHPRSAIQGELFFRTPKLLNVSANGNYDTYAHYFISTAESVGVNTKPVQFDITHQYLREPRTQFLVGGAGLKLGKWSLNSRIWRDVEHGKTTQEEYRAQYASQCWGLGISYIFKPGEVQYMVMFDLKGLGTLKF